MCFVITWISPQAPDAGLHRCPWRHTTFSQRVRSEHHRDLSSYCTATESSWFGLFGWPHSVNEFFTPKTLTTNSRHCVANLSNCTWKIPTQLNRFCNGNIQQRLFLFHNKLLSETRHYISSDLLGKSYHICRWLDWGVSLTTSAGDWIEV